MGCPGESRDTREGEGREKEKKICQTNNLHIYVYKCHLLVRFIFAGLIRQPALSTLVWPDSMFPLKFLKNRHQRSLTRSHSLPLALDLYVRMYDEKTMVKRLRQQSKMRKIAIPLGNISKNTSGITLGKIVTEITNRLEGKTKKTRCFPVTVIKQSWILVFHRR